MERTLVKLLHNAFFGFIVICREQDPDKDPDGILIRKFSVRSYPGFECEINKS
jgi:hypothetical protein